MIRIALAMKNYSSAISDYESVLGWDGSYEIVYYNMAMVYLSMNDAEKACRNLIQYKEFGHNNADKIINEKCISNDDSISH